MKNEKQELTDTVSNSATVGGYAETGNLQRIVKFSKAFDKRNPEPSKNYGVGGVNCWMILKGEKGAVQFAFTTGIYLPHVLDEWEAKGYANKPMGMDVGYHSPTPMYEGQTQMDNCDLSPEGKCYYDGSGLRGEDWFKIFMEEGDEAIWKLLEEDYKERFSA